ncbi:MAG: PorT family protein [Chlorobi bacterium]|nr:PorT family protein [Chlorobiota bacterium]
MKRILLIATLVLGQVTYAQGGWLFGVRGGAGIPLLLNSNWMNDGNYTYEPGLTWNVGAMAGYNAVYYNYGFTLGFHYRQTKHTLRYTSVAGTQDPEILQISSIEIPLLMRFRPSGDARTRMITYGGWYFEIGVQAASYNAVQYTYESKNQAVGTVQMNITHAFKTWDFQGVIGFGFHQVGTERLAITHGIKIFASILDIVEPQSGNGWLLAPLFEYGQMYPYQPTRFITIQYLLSIIYKIPKNGR